MIFLDKMELPPQVQNLASYIPKVKYLDFAFYRFDMHNNGNRIYSYSITYMIAKIEGVFHSQLGYQLVEL